MPLSTIEQIQFVASADAITFALGEGVAFGFTGIADEARQAHHARPKQVHGIDVVPMSGVSGQQKSILADGVFTRTRGQSIAVVTADCLPILMFDDKAEMVMAIHAGWRGLVSGIAEQAVRHFQQQGFLASQLYTVCGPCISPAVYEVGPEVKDAVVRGAISLQADQAAAVLRRGIDDRWFLDLATAACLSLANFGLSPDRMAVVRRCTFSEAGQWFSYRRTKSYQGNNFSWISLV